MSLSSPHAPLMPSSLPLLHRVWMVVWMVSSKNHVTDIQFNLPGAVFVDYDGVLGRTSGEHQSRLAITQRTAVFYVSDTDTPDRLAPSSTRATASTSSRNVARVVVTSDS